MTDKLRWMICICLLASLPLAQACTEDGAASGDGDTDADTDTDTDTDTDGDLCASYPASSGVIGVGQVVDNYPFTDIDGNARELCEWAGGSRTVAMVSISTTW